MSFDRVRRLLWLLFWIPLVCAFGQPANPSEATADGVIPDPAAADWSFGSEEEYAAQDRLVVGALTRSQLPDQRRLGLVELRSLAEAGHIRQDDGATLRVLAAIASPSEISRPRMPSAPTFSDRVAAIVVLAAIGGPAADAILRDLVRIESDPQLIAQALSALQQIDSSADARMSDIIAELAYRNNGAWRDESLATALIETLRWFNDSAGGFVDPLLFSRLAAMTQPPFSASVRRMAARLMRDISRPPD